MASCLRASLQGWWGVVGAKRTGQTAREQLRGLLVNFLQ